MIYLPLILLYVVTGSEQLSNEVDEVEIGSAMVKFIILFKS